jgi:hypothetical protein
LILYRTEWNAMCDQSGLVPDISFCRATRNLARFPECPWPDRSTSSSSKNFLRAYIFCRMGTCTRTKGVRFSSRPLPASRLYVQNCVIAISIPDKQTNSATGHQLYAALQSCYNHQKVCSFCDQLRRLSCQQYM